MERRRDSARLDVGDGWPVLIYEGLNLGLGKSRLGGEIADADRCAAPLVHQQAQQVTVMQSIAGHCSPFTCPRFWTREASHLAQRLSSFLDKRSANNSPKSGGPVCGRVPVRGQWLSTG